MGGDSITCIWDVLSKAKYHGDDIGDAFLDEVSISSIYSSKNVFDLARTSGPAGQRFLACFETVPSWVNIALVERGAAFQRRWIEVYFAGGLAAIIESYGYATGAQILMETGRLVCATDATRRLLETAMFNLTVIEFGLSPSSPALEVIARVRLLHCMVRRHIRQACPWWDSTTMGVPVNQEDGAHTIFLNSYSTLRAMELQGLPVNASEKQAVSKFWAYIGHLLGLREEFLPKSFAEETVMYQSIFDHSFSPSNDSHTLTAATLQASTNLPPYRFNLHQVSALARLTLGETLSDALLLPQVTRFEDKLFLLLVYTLTVAKYIIYTLFGYRPNNVPWMRSVLLSNLREHGIDEAKWRFVITGKSTTSTS